MTQRRVGSAWATQGLAKGVEALPRRGLLSHLIIIIVAFVLLYFRPSILMFASFSESRNLAVT